jgi:hypothetical protein
VAFFILVRWLFWWLLGLGVDRELPISKVSLTEVRRLREGNDHLRSLLIANGIPIFGGSHIKR